MNPQSLLVGIPWLSDNLLALGGLVLLVGIVLVNFWKEVLVGALAIVLIGRYFSINESTDGKQPQVQESPIVMVQESAKPETQEPPGYFEDCMALTQKPDVCAEIWAQLSSGSHN